jgi:hypothetical protein
MDGCPGTQQCHPSPEISNSSLENQIIKEVKYREMSVILARDPEGSWEDHQTASAVWDLPQPYRHGN